VQRVEQPAPELHWVALLLNREAPLAGRHYCLHIGAQLARVRCLLKQPCQQCTYGRGFCHEIPFIDSRTEDSEAPLASRPT
jgi:hypothetical protein